jgi:hypothetical protein
VWTLETVSDLTNVQDYPGIYNETAAAAISSRGYFISWLDLKGQFWVFGGTPGNSSTLNDLWKLNSMPLL